MTQWGYDEPQGIIIGGNYETGQLFYDGQPQGGKFTADTQTELLKIAKIRKTELIKEYGGYPCFCYQDDSKWEMRSWKRKSKLKN